MTQAMIVILVMLKSRATHKTAYPNSAAVVCRRTNTRANIVAAGMMRRNGMAKPWLDKAVATWRRRRRGSPRPLTQDLVSRLMCLTCRRTELSLEGSEIVCGSCGTGYEKRAGLFDFDA